MPTPAETSPDYSPDINTTEALTLLLATVLEMEPEELPHPITCKADAVYTMHQMFKDYGLPWNGGVVPTSNKQLAYKTSTITLRQDGAATWAQEIEIGNYSMDCMLIDAYAQVEEAGSSRNYTAFKPLSALGITAYIRVADDGERTFLYLSAETNVTISGEAYFLFADTKLIDELPATPM